jgi:hypothetical protein
VPVANALELFLLSLKEPLLSPFCPQVVGLFLNKYAFIFKAIDISDNIG